LAGFFQKVAVTADRRVVQEARAKADQERHQQCEQFPSEELVTVHFLLLPDKTERSCAAEEMCFTTVDPVFFFVWCRSAGKKGPLLFVAATPWLGKWILPRKKCIAAGFWQSGGTPPHVEK
jgi:hypothetical protein